MIKNNGSHDRHSPIFRRFSPSYLFGGGVPGAWYDPSDFSTMFQDSTGTTPVTAVDQPVGLILDKSGYGNSAFQTTDASRPLLKIDGNGKYYLLFDGSNDSLRTNNINLTSTNKVSVFAGLRKQSDALRGVVAEFSPTVGTNPGSFLMASPNSAGASDAVWFSRGSTFSGNPASATGLVAPITFVATGTGDIAGDSAIIRINGVVSGTESGDQGTGNYGNHSLFIGRRNNASVPFNGNLYSLIIVGKTMTADELSLTESWVNGKTGAY